jgi:hypothetical protein
MIVERNTMKSARSLISAAAAMRRIGARTDAADTMGVR